MIRKRRGEAAWWSAPGAELCEFCRHSFRIEVGFYCAHCDRPVCPVCAVTVHEVELTICADCEGERR